MQYYNKLKDRQKEAFQKRLMQKLCKYCVGNVTKLSTERLRFISRLCAIRLLFAQNIDEQFNLCVVRTKIKMELDKRIYKDNVVKFRRINT